MSVCVGLHFTADPLLTNLTSHPGGSHVEKCGISLQADLFQDGWIAEALDIAEIEYLLKSCHTASSPLNKELFLQVRFVQRPMHREAVDELKRMLREAVDELTQLTDDGLKLQTRIAKVKFGLSSSPDASHADSGESNRQYVENLNRVAELYHVFKSKQDTFNTKITRLNRMLDEEDENAAELRESFRQFKRELCKAAVFNRTGSTISMKKMEKLEAMELEQDCELESLRLKHIHFRNQLKKQEETVKQKEQLSEGLHLIDFEQLKIENQTLNEKIEERNDDLHKLKKKTTTTVQVLTHIKEKIDFIEQENHVLRDKFSSLDRELQSKRDQMTKTKRIRDRLRVETAKLKERQGFVGSPLLVQDFESKKLELQTLKDEIAAAKERYEASTRRVAQ